MNLPIMENDGNDVIRYLMDEMDPSQEVLMERAMMEDDDLLIEVESMRQTLKRLDELPEKKPSQELTNQILEKAEEHQKTWVDQLPTIPSEVYKYAAVLLLGVGLSSGYWMMFENSNKTGINGKVSPASVQSSLPSTYQAASTSTQETGIEPWVDHNNVLYFQDQFNSNSTAYQGLVEASKEKVTPLQGPPSFNFRSRNLQLTGAHK